jgi:hypothetical protein
MITNAIPGLPGFWALWGANCQQYAYIGMFFPGSGEDLFTQGICAKIAVGKDLKQFKASDFQSIFTDADDTAEVLSTPDGRYIAITSRMGFLIGTKPFINKFEEHFDKAAEKFEEEQVLEETAKAKAEAPEKATANKAGKKDTSPSQKEDSTPSTGKGLTVTMNRPSGLWTWLNRRSYAAYIIHPVVLVGISLLLRGCAAPALVKFAVTGTLACATCWIQADPLVRVPGLRRIV